MAEMIRRSIAAAAVLTMITGAAVTLESSARIMAATDEPAEETPESTNAVKVRDHILTECRRSRQSIIVRGTGHAYSDAIGYRYTLRKGSRNGIVLSVRRAKGKAVFRDLNVGDLYYVQVQEYSGEKIYSDTQVYLSRTPVKAAYRVYRSRKKLGMALEKKAVRRARTFIVYFSRKDMDAWDIITDRPLLSLPFSYLAAVGWDYCRSRNRYGQAIRINGRRYYKYKFRFADYQYTKRQQKLYIRRIRRLAGSLKGTSAGKVRKLNRQIGKIRYDDAEYRRWMAGRINDSPTSAYSAYAALVKKKAVCQGIAEAAALVLDRAGVRCESVGGKNLRTGNGHAWNIVRSGRKWYWCDFCYSIWGRSEILMGSRAFNRYHRLDRREYAEQMSRVGKIAA